MFPLIFPLTSKEKLKCDISSKENKTIIADSKCVRDNFAITISISKFLPSDTYLIRIKNIPNPEYTVEWPDFFVLVSSGNNILKLGNYRYIDNYTRYYISKGSPNLIFKSGNDVLDPKKIFVMDSFTYIDKLYILPDDGLVILLLFFLIFILFI